MIIIRRTTTTKTTTTTTTTTTIIIKKVTGNIIPISALIILKGEFHMRWSILISQLPHLLRWSQCLTAPAQLRQSGFLDQSVAAAVQEGRRSGGTAPPGNAMGSMGKPWENHGEIMGKHGKSWKIMENWMEIDHGFLWSLTLVLSRRSYIDSTCQFIVVSGLFLAICVCSCVPTFCMTRPNIAITVRSQCVASCGLCDGKFGE